MKGVEIIFGTLEPQKKLELIDEIPDEILLTYNLTEPVMMRIIKECGGRNERFRINGDRCEGNKWNSVVEGIENYRGKIVVDVYIQDDSTDTNTTIPYVTLLGDTELTIVRSRVGNALYRKEAKARVVRSILKEYVYYTYIEKEAREAQEKIDKLLHYSIVNPVYNHYFKEWDCWHRMDYNKDIRDRYYGGVEAVEAYAEAHVEELSGKSTDELQNIYKKVFVGEKK